MLILTLKDEGIGVFFLIYYEQLVNRYYGEGISPEQLEIEIENTINWFVEKYKDEIEPIQFPEYIKGKLNLKSNYINFIGDYK